MFYKANKFNNGEKTPGAAGGASLTLDTSQVTNMSNMFRDAENFNQELAFTSTAKATNMQGMFREASIFNSGKTAGDHTPVSGLKDWDTSFLLLT